MWLSNYYILVIGTRSYTPYWAYLGEPICFFIYMTLSLSLLLKGVRPSFSSPLIFQIIPKHWVLQGHGSTFMLIRS